MSTKIYKIAKGVISIAFKECRKNAKLTLQEASDMLGVTRQAIMKWESGKSIPNTKHAIKMCIAYNVNFKALIKGEPWLED